MQHNLTASSTVRKWTGVSWFIECDVENLDTDICLRLQHLVEDHALFGLLLHQSVNAKRKAGGVGPKDALAQPWQWGNVVFRAGSRRSDTVRFAPRCRFAQGVGYGRLRVYGANTAFRFARGARVYKLCRSAPQTLASLAKWRRVASLEHLRFLQWCGAFNLNPAWGKRSDRNELLAEGETQDLMIFLRAPLRSRHSGLLRCLVFKRVNCGGHYAALKSLQRGAAGLVKKQQQASLLPLGGSGNSKRSQRPLGTRYPHQLDEYINLYTKTVLGKGPR